MAVSSSLLGSTEYAKYSYTVTHCVTSLILPSLGERVVYTIRGNLERTCNAKNMPDDSNSGGAAPAAALAEGNNPVTPTGDQGGQQANSPDAGQAKDNEGKDADLDKFEDDGAEPVVKQRKTAKDFIIERQQRKIAKMQKQGGDGEGGESDDDDDSGNPAGNGKDGGKDGDDATQMEALRPIIDQHLADQDAQEVTSFLEGNPDFAPYTSQVERWMKHESRRQIPVDELFYAAAGKHLLKMGADRVRKADAAAKDTQSGGASNRQGVAPIDWSKATREELEAEKQRVRERSAR